MRGMDPKQIVASLITCSKPQWWLRTLGAMIVGIAVAIPSPVPYWSRILVGFFDMGVLLWGGLYTLNDWADADQDRKHPFKKFRPIPSGRLSKDTALTVAIISVILALVIALSLGRLFFLCALAMAMNQLLYSLRWFRLKEKPVLDILSGSMINPSFRFLGGWFLFRRDFNIPLLPLIVIVAFQILIYTVYKTSSRQIDQALGFKSTAALSRLGIRLITLFAAIIAFLSVFFLVSNGVLFRQVAFLGSAPPQVMLILLVPSVLAYTNRHLLEKPEKLSRKDYERLNNLGNTLYAVCALLFAGMMWGYL